MADDEELYDEFGNYIGPALESSEDEESSEEESRLEDQDEASQVSSVDHHMQQDEQGDEEERTAPAVSAIVLHEDKLHYPSAEEVYGEHIRAVVLDEDAMELDQPIVKPVRTKVFSLVQDDTRADYKRAVSATELGEGGGKTKEETAQRDLVSNIYLTSTLLANETTNTRRGVALCGHLHTGKTTLLDMILEQQMVTNHPDALGSRASLPAADGGGPRLSDALLSEQARQLSLKSTPVTIALPDTRGKHYALTFIDCPGHTQFHDESVAAMRVSDGVVIVVDAVEGIMMHTTMVVSQALAEGLPMVLCINKVDRLIVELKLPPGDAYFKLLHVIESVNELVAEKAGPKMSKYYVPFAPDRGNVCFASSQHGWSFTLGSMAQHYADADGWGDGSLGKNITVEDFAKRLWGDCYLDESSRTFHRHARECTSVDGTPVRRTFVQFILEPLYKLYAVCLGESEKDVEKILRGLGVLLSKEQLRSSARPLLRAACKRFFGPSTGLVDMIVKHIPSPIKAAKGKVSRCYTGPLNSKVAQSMMECSSRGPLMIHVVKLYPSPDGQSFSAFGRIYSGTVKPGDKVKVLGEAYSPEDDEDMTTATVSAISIPQARRRTEITRATAGNWVLLEGVDSAIAKTATITGVGDGGYDDDDEGAQIFAPLSFPQCGFESAMKLAVEPLNAAELPKMVEGLRRISKSYPMARTRVEESGEHVLFGTGELYLDCVMHDLRHVYADIEIKVSDPVVGFRETVVETSSLQCFAETPNKRNKLTFIAEPLSEGLAEKLEAGKVDILHWDNKKLGRYFQTQYDWDLLSSRSVWAFGASPTHGTNILLDDTLPSEVDKQLLNTCKSSIVQGFQWAVREGPLCEEPVRSTKVKILDAILADKPIHRGGGQIIPTARRTVHSALLTAAPRIMEPVYQLHIQCGPDIMEAIQPLITKRRGHIVQDRPIAGTPLCVVKAFMPVIDSFGFETDLRTFTQGQAMVHSVFDHWAIVPGDPIDNSIVLHPLEPSPLQHLAREFVVKTRRRKGLAEDVSISRFFDEGMKALLAQQLEEEVE